jgi:rubrerythrin
MPVDVASLSVEKALSMAAKSETEAVEAYLKLQSMVKNFILKDKLSFLAEEEKKHQKLLKEVYKKVTGGKEPPETERSLAPRLALALREKTTVTDLLELAMGAEKISEEFYDNLSQNIEERGLQEILQYLASMEHGHYFLLKGEYELCLKDEEYYDREDFQYDMVHIGP